MIFNDKKHSYTRRIKSDFKDKTPNRQIENNMFKGTLFAFSHILIRKKLVIKKCIFPFFMHCI